MKRHSPYKIKAACAAEKRMSDFAELKPDGQASLRCVVSGFEIVFTPDPAGRSTKSHENCSCV
jgi:hypothetical protein